ncbi:sphingomyelin phosphodiesterase, putative, partial [Ixodes scapularis]
LPSSSWSTFEKAGYYNWTISRSLRLVCLNSMLWYAGNKAPAPKGSVDDQLVWLREQLQEAHQLGQKVFISGHVAPGFYTHVLSPELGTSGLLRDEINEAYQDLIANFMDVVSGQFFGHQHANSFVVLLLDYTVYYLDYDKANMHPNETPKWEPLYTLTTQYGVPDVTTASMVDLSQRLNSSSELLDTYIWLTTAFNDSCDSFCRRVQLCSAMCSRAVPHSACITS